MTRTLWVTNDFPPRPGGIEQFLANLVNRLDPAETCVLTHRVRDADGHDAAVDYRVVRIGRRPLLPGPALLRHIRALAAQHRADVVVFGSSWPLGELGRHLDLPTLALSHGHEAGMVRVGLGPAIRRVARAVDALGVISAFTRAALEPWAGPHTRLVDLSPGVDVTAFNPTVDGAGVRRRHGMPDDAEVVVCISRLVPRKGQDVLVDAWPAVVSRRPQARLLIVGTGPQGRALRRRVTRLGVEGTVTLTGGVSWTELPAYHAAADLFAMPCRTRLAGLDVEGLGIVYLEAQATGVPVIAGRSGGAPDALVDGETGLVVDGTDVAALADAVSALLADPPRRRAMGEAGRRFVEERYAWPVIVDRLQAALEVLAEARAD